MRKPRSYAEVYNDLDGEIVDLFRVLQDRAAAADLERLLRVTPFARAEFGLSYQESPDLVERARRTLIRAFMGFGANGHNSDRKTGFRANSNRSSTTAPNDWANYPDCLAAFTDRLAGVVVENRDAREVMLQQDSEDTLHFLDPPYIHDTRTCWDGYRFEMTDAEHESLCEFIVGLRGMVMLCGYRHPIYDSLGWQTVERRALADGAGERTEVLWLNPACVNAGTQLHLFAEAP